MLEESVQLGLEDGMGTNRILHWCGAQLQVSSSFYFVLFLCDTVIVSIELHPALVWCTAAGGFYVFT